MKTNKTKLPHQDNRLYVTDSGLETELIFHDGIDLPLFASFPLLETQVGRERLQRYYTGFLEEAVERGVSCLLETPTWRAGAGWAAQLGFDAEACRRINGDAIRFLNSVADPYRDNIEAIAISGNIGPLDDGYSAASIPTPEEAEQAHDLQISAFANAGADMVSAFTITNVGEAIGISRSAQDHALPVVISFTLETDGKLPTGQDLGDAIAQVDEATGSAPIYYMINCAHPDHFSHLFERAENWHGRIGGIRANASRKSHAELDESTELDEGNPREFGTLHSELIDRLPSLKVIGGCCGTDRRHVREAMRCCA